MKERKKAQRTYNGIDIDSEEEYMMLLWVEELMEYGYVESVERAETFILSEPITTTYKQTIQMKTKDKVVEKKQELLKGHVYTPEFKIRMTDDRLVYNHALMQGKQNNKLLLGRMNEVYVEIKPEWDKNNMERLFKINQKWVADKYGIIVNLIKPIQLYEQTFMPQKWLTTDTGKKRIIHIPIRDIEEWVKTLN